MSLRVGQKVVCVNAKRRWISHVIGWIFRLDWPLVEGAVYTVSRLAIVHGQPGVELVEVKNIKEMDRCFRRDRFRPVVERKTDISVFTEMLHKAPVRAPAVLLTSKSEQ